MGQRANYAIVTASGYDLFYSHWGADVLLRDFFWGPQASEAFVRNQTPVAEWLNIRWCEGGAVLDPIQRRLLLFGGVDETYNPYLHSLYLRLLECAWPDWKVDWAYEGILDLVRSLEVADAVVDLPEGRTPPRPRTPNLTRPQDPWCHTLVHLDGGWYTLENDLQDLLPHGPSLVAHLQKLPQHTLMGEDPPVAVLGIDSPSRQLFYFQAVDCPFLSSDTATAWKGWQTRLDRRQSYALLEQSVAWWQPPSHEDCLQNLLHTLRRPDQDRGQMFASATQLLQNRGCQVEVNTPLAFQDPRPTSTQDWREQWLGSALSTYRAGPRPLGFP